jgi:arabinogalactan endo-1,4-beta-galactosidase
MPSFDTRISLVVFFALNSCGNSEVDHTLANGNSTTYGGAVGNGSATFSDSLGRGGDVTVFNDPDRVGRDTLAVTPQDRDQRNSGGAPNSTATATTTGSSIGGVSSNPSVDAGGSSVTNRTSTYGTVLSTDLPKHIVGADVTISLEDEYWGATYTDGDTRKPIEQLLKDHGFNFVRLGIFVDPKAADGYAAKMKEGFRDLEHTITFAKRIKTIEMGFLLDLHYSNNWADPTKQTTPISWADLELAALSSQVYNYTKEVVSTLRAAGAAPNIVQVGNEITNGMLWNNGKISNNDFSGFTTLLKSGINAVREVDPNVKIMLHIEKCNDYATTKWWLDGVIHAGVSFDILGQSCYATAPNGVVGYQGTPSQWTSVFSRLASDYPSLKFMIAEYSAEQRAAHDTMRSLPNGRGLGAFNWDPTRAYSTHPNDPLFKTNGEWNNYVAIPERMAIYDTIALERRSVGITGNLAAIVE